MQELMQTVQHELPATAAVINRFGLFQQEHPLKGCKEQVQQLCRS